MGDINTYFTTGKVVAQSGDVKVYSMDNQLFLEIGPAHDLWALESEAIDYIDQLKDEPKGKCLEIGLGLGVASRCLLTYPQVKHLTTVETNIDIIETHKQLIPLLDKKAKKWLPYTEDRHTIVNCEGLEYLLITNAKYDFIFLDFYKGIDEDSLPAIEDMVNAARECLTDRGIIRGWFDPYTPLEFVDEFNDLFQNR